MHHTHDAQSKKTSALMLLLLLVTTTQEVGPRLGGEELTFRTTSSTSSFSFLHYAAQLLQFSKATPFLTTGKKGRATITSEDEEDEEDMPFIPFLTLRDLLTLRRVSRKYHRLVRHFVKFPRGDRLEGHAVFVVWPGLGAQSCRELSPKKMPTSRFVLSPSLFKRLFVGQLHKDITQTAPMLIWALRMLSERRIDITHIEPHTSTGGIRGKGCAWLYLTDPQTADDVVAALHRRVYWDRWVGPQGNVVEGAWVVLRRRNCDLSMDALAQYATERFDDVGRSQFRLVLPKHPVVIEEPSQGWGGMTLPGVGPTTTMKRAMPSMKKGIAVPSSHHKGCMCSMCVVPAAPPAVLGKCPYACCTPGGPPLPPTYDPPAYSPYSFGYYAPPPSMVSYASLSRYGY